MSHFKQAEVNFGTIRQDKVKVFEFQALPTIPEIDRIEASCGCSKPSFNPVNKVLSITYKAGKIPKQVPGNQTIYLTISVMYKNGTSEALTIKGTKIR